ncbi:unnamed protein product [Adineta steineri]|uniref:Uncharacterized protein n=1 Tax=Adineta steineri TaxID=433720 RepID=A0A816D314_9BILA|nr:unnamed protein product [Adineta steineri]CAF1631033.1 unnamed protein product [Adineta steineri]
MPDFGACSEPTCNQTAVRLFDCAHHCMKMVCLQHLIEHDRLFERNKKYLEGHQLELKRLYSIYSSLVDENKIRYEYEQKLDDYKRLVIEVNTLLDHNYNDVEQFRSTIEKLKKMIHEKQKQSDESLTIVKVEPIEENADLTMNSEKDESLYIGFDRLQNEPIIANDDDDHDIIPTVPSPRIAGACPLWVNGAYGLNKKYHSVRLCRRKDYTDLSNHIRQYHGLLTPFANIISRAVDANIPATICLIKDNVQVADPYRSFLCPFRAECSNQYWLPVAALKNHLIDVHHMDPPMAEMKIRKIKKLNKNKPMPKLGNRIREIVKYIDSVTEDQRKHVHIKQ